jgi:hypothetical protein
VKSGKLDEIAAVFAGRCRDESMLVHGGVPERVRSRAMMIEGRMLKPEDRIYDLVDLLEESPGLPADGQRAGRPGPEKIYDLIDVVDRKPKMAFVDTGLRDEIMKRATEIAERVAREIIPDVAERIIREEIERLKKGI